MTKHIKLQKDYTASCLYYQIKLPLDIEKNIPSDDPVRLLSTFVEGMKLSDLYNTYGKIKKISSPKQLLKIVIYAGMNRIYSSRDIEKSCRQDINFMYLLEESRFRIMRLLRGSSHCICPNVPQTFSQKFQISYTN